MKTNVEGKQKKWHELRNSMTTIMFDPVFSHMPPVDFDNNNKKKKKVTTRERKENENKCRGQRKEMA